MPLNFRYAGFILSAIPEAKIIHIHRDPMATCWSIYKYFFNEQWRKIPALTITRGMPNSVANMIAIDSGLQGKNLTISNAFATVSNVTNTTADVTLSSALSLEVNEGIRITNVTDGSYNDVVRVSAINGSVISITSSFA